MTCIKCDKMVFAKELCKHHYTYERKSEKPFFYAFHRLTANAKRRGVEMNLSLAEFKKFATDTDYINKRGRHKNDLHIDRIDNTIGYEIGNIQTMTCSENSKKGGIEKKYKKRGFKLTDYRNLVKRQLALSFE